MKIFLAHITGGLIVLFLSLGGINLAYPNALLFIAIGIMEAIFLDLKIIQAHIVGAFTVIMIAHIGAGYFLEAFKALLMIIIFEILIFKTLKIS